jgi:hypothetical protein
MKIMIGDIIVPLVACAILGFGYYKAGLSGLGWAFGILVVLAVVWLVCDFRKETKKTEKEDEKIRSS